MSKVRYHIINSEIEKLFDDKVHPFFGYGGEKELFNHLFNILKERDPKIEKEIFQNSFSKLFAISFLNVNYKIFIEHSDDGGLGKESQKIEVPLGRKYLQNKFIEEKENFIVMNGYIPLLKKLDSTIELDVKNVVYFIVKRSNIKTYKNRTKGRKNTSRMVSLKDIKEVIDNKSWKLNRTKNTYIVHSSMIKYLDIFFLEEAQNFFDDNKNEEFDKLIDKLFEAEEENNNEDEMEELKLKQFQNINSIRVYFRNSLLKASSKCDILYCDISEKELLVASHIKSVENIVKDKSLGKSEKHKEIRNYNNGLLLCPNHDALFDKHYISFNSKGFLISAKVIHNKLEIYNLKLDEPSISKLNDETKFYLKFHNNLLIK
ncbi:HNH endonuclease signature motif containing protein [[Mycoplasma] mobile]|uniref:Possible restriction endonuclease protein n=1 Tax=Mycoplasma mobile (strain ATCC 43663 / 163K / NCTC 11711) TaxID=267748 RepID=Q6KH34_MYCM1|nr:HNH endonuclease signature motif containing protein [[Mycoplasma] mobile]AAT28097.1 possible restriction endonuclease protein [Mycoplasma mobile 163K]